MSKTMYPKTSERMKIIDEEVETRTGLDLYLWHVVAYATLGSLLVFRLAEWLDSHAYDYYRAEYHSASWFWFLVPAVLNLFALYVIFRTARATDKFGTFTTSTLALLVVFASNFIGHLGYNMTRLHLFPTTFHTIIASTVWLGCWMHYTTEHSISKMSFQMAKREYETSVRLFGNFLHAITFLLIAGGAALTIAAGGEFGKTFLLEDTLPWWPYVMFFALFYWTYGGYVIFLSKFLEKIEKLNWHMENASRSKIHTGRNCYE